MKDKQLKENEKVNMTFTPVLNTQERFALSVSF